MHYIFAPSKLIFWGSLLLLSLLSIHAHSASSRLNYNKEDLFHVGVKVATQSQRDLEEASKRAMEKLLIRVSGDAHIIRTPVLSGILERANEFYSAYSYKTSLEYTDEGKSNLEVWFAFDQEIVLRLFHELEIPFWSASRPSLLLWIVKNDGVYEEIISPDTPEQFVDTISDYADNRALPLRLPMLTVKERSAVSPSAITDEDWYVLEQMSKPYQVHAIGVGKLYYLADSDKWYGAWNIRWDDEVFLYEEESEDLSRLSIGFLDYWSNLLVERFISDTSLDQQMVQVRVTGILSLKDYANFIHYLGKLDYVFDFFVQTFAQDYIDLEMSLGVSNEAFLNLVAIDGKLLLLPSSSEELSFLSEPVLSFEWK